MAGWSQQAVSSPNLIWIINHSWFKNGRDTFGPDPYLLIDLELELRLKDSIFYAATYYPNDLKDVAWSGDKVCRTLTNEDFIGFWPSDVGSIWCVRPWTQYYNMGGGNWQASVGLGHVSLATPLCVTYDANGIITLSRRPQFTENMAPYCNSVPCPTNSPGTYCVPDKLTITLSGYATTEPWHKKHDPKHLKANIPYKAIVTQNGQPKANIPVTITTDVTENSGGHIHTDGRPKGKLVDKVGANVSTKDGKVTIPGKTDSNGVFEFTFGAEEASGIHTVTAKCEGCLEAVSLTADVKVDGLFPIPTSPFYSMQLPNRDTNHPNTNYLTKSSRNTLSMIATLYGSATYYQSKQGVIPDFVLNDASLEWGGLLDCFLTCNSAMYPSTPWNKHHIEHRRGSVVDVKANGTPGSIVYEAKLRKIAKGEGVNIGNPHGSGSGRHYHIRLNNGAKE